MKHHKHKVKRAVKVITDFSLHIWIIVLFANVLLVYTFHFYLYASNEKPVDSVIKPTPIASDLVVINQEGSSTEEEQPVEEGAMPTLVPEPTEYVPPVPNGPLVGLSFSVPGIGSGGGNLRPIHPTRNVTIYLYKTGVNVFDKRINPLYTIKTKAYYDADKRNPMYTSFSNRKIDLGSKVADGDYQVVLKTDLSFRLLVKEKPSSVGGIVFSFDRKETGDDYPVISHQTMIMGDVFPKEPDNIADLGDYNALVHCFEVRRGNPLCPNPYQVDLNDDAVINGLDYNLMVLGFKNLQALGFDTPELIIPPTNKKVSRLGHLTPQPTKNVEATPTPLPENTTESTSGGGGMVGLLALLFILALVGGGGFFLYMKNPKFRATIAGILHRTTPAPPAAGQPGAAQSNPSQTGAAPATTESSNPSQTFPTNPASPSSPPSPTPSTSSGSTTPASPEQPAAPADVAAPASDTKEYFVKKDSEDETKTGFWLTITGDNGPELAHYKGTDVKDGFAQVKGEKKTENGKTFLEISELTPEE